MNSKPKFFKTILKEFERLEIDLELDDESILKCKWWEGIRYDLFQEIITQTNYLNQRKIPLNYIDKIKKIFSKIKKLIYDYPIKSPFIINKNSILIFSSNRRVRKSGKYIDIYADCFIDLLPKELDYAFLEGPIYGKHNKPHKKYNIYYIDYINQLSKLISLALRVIFIFKPRNNNIEYLKRILLLKYNNDFNLKKRINSYVLQFISTYIIAYRLFRLKRPTHIFFVDSLAYLPYISAAKNLGIPTIELQHGSPARGKLNYDYSSGIKHSSFPDWFASFGDYWLRENILPIEKQKIISFGFPFFANSLKKEKDEIPVENYFLIISQPTIAQELVDFSIKLRRILDSSIQIVFKPHPLEYLEDNLYFDQLRKQSILVAEKNISLYELFIKSNWQLGVYSTAIYEGLSFGLKTYIMKIAGCEYMDELIKSGLAELVDNVNQIDIEKSRRKIDSSTIFKIPTNESIDELLKMTQI
tara:strand:+ start:2498 stop:3913 length:1416 start_codon:yes stop_codon:yes gene_type:complete